MKTKKYIITLILLTIAWSTGGFAQTVRHSKVGDKLSINGALSLTLVTKHQNYNWSDRGTIDGDISSPKSVKFRPDGKKYYVNSLEGGRTVVYDAITHKKIKVIKHIFKGTENNLWAKPSGLFPFRKYLKNQNSFMGKPVESTFSHSGRYLWIPYYRRSYDINAQDPSAVAIIDTERDTIIRMMETGPLPKMITVSPNGRTLAVTHWGDNTVGLIDISSKKPEDWHYTSCAIIEHKLKMDFSTTNSINRDAVSGLKLRGTTFMPDSKYLLVSCMCGTGIAVVNTENGKYLGMIYGASNNVRHLLIKNGYLYLSANMPGKVQRIPLDSITNAIKHIQRHTTVKGWQTCQVFTGTRTISSSPSGNYIFAACSYSSQLAVIDTRTMKCIGQTVVDSYPVGLDISPDGRTLITTSQGSGGLGGNSVNVFKVDYNDYSAEQKQIQDYAINKASDDDTLTQDTIISSKADDSKATSSYTNIILLALCCCIALVLCVFAYRKFNN